MQVSVEEYTLHFRELAITSRDRMTSRLTRILRISGPEIPGGEITGEIAMFKGLSAEDTPDFPAEVEQFRRRAEGCHNLEELIAAMPQISSIRFGVESALIRGGLYPLSGQEYRWLDGKEGIRINGLVWMGDKPTMRRRIREKLDSGFRCIKLKIGGINFEEELDLLKAVREEFPPEVVELRLDANGAFTPENALERLERLSKFHIHSIEQPIRQGQPEAMARICRESPIPIALDEELIGMHTDREKAELLDIIMPAYIILKPSLCGGFREAERWIAAATSREIGWWGTSALESDIGLEALGRWTASMQPVIPQGLGTGNLYTNNFPSQLRLKGERLWYEPKH